MKKNNVVELTKPETQSDMLTDLLVTGAHDMLHKAIEVEVAAFVQSYEDRLTDTGRQAVVRSGYQPERSLETGLGPVTIKVPKHLGRRYIQRHTLRGYQAVCISYYRC